MNEPGTIIIIIIKKKMFDKIPNKKSFACLIFPQININTIMMLSGSFILNRTRLNLRVRPVDEELMHVNGEFLR